MTRAADAAATRTLGQQHAEQQMKIMMRQAGRRGQPDLEDLPVENDRDHRCYAQQSPSACLHRGDFGHQRIGHVDEFGLRHTVIMQFEHDFGETLRSCSPRNDDPHGSAGRPFGCIFLEVGISQRPPGTRQIAFSGFRHNDNFGGDITRLCAIR